MSESVQAVLGLIMMAGLIGSVIVWMDDYVNWPARLGFPGAALVAFGFLIWSILRRDKVPDLLSRTTRRYFERDGFCFAILSRTEKGGCFLDCIFQSRYSGPSQARVVLQPSKGFWLNRPNLASLTVEVDCPAGGYGVTRIPWAVAEKFQGKTQSIDVAAHVTYPDGRGKMIRYRGGVQVGSTQGDLWKGIMTVAGAMGGMIVLTKPAHMKIKMPKDVAETVPDDAPIVTQVLWRLGDSTNVTVRK